MSGAAEARAGRDALDQVDAALADRPKRDGTALKAAIQGLARFRDRLAARHRDEGGTRWRPELERANAVLSVVMAAAFPIGEVPWDELAKARGWLEALVRDVDGVAGDQ